MALGCAGSQSRWGQPQSLFLVQFLFRRNTSSFGINGSVFRTDRCAHKRFNEKRYKDGDERTCVTATIGSVTLDFTILLNFEKIIPEIPLAHECSYSSLGP
jgi:hypothetical protein